MIVGIPKEIKTSEFRVAITPAGVRHLTSRGHEVLVEQGAGLGAGFTDGEYAAQGARLCAEAAEVWEHAALVAKVKEPLPGEYPWLRPDLVLFTYCHFAASATLTRAVLDSGCTAIAYETVEDDRGGLPLLTPMSEVAGRMAVQEGARFLEKTQGGSGILLGGVTGVAPARVLILGAGVVGVNAARMAAGLGARVALLDINPSRLRQLEGTLPANVETLVSDALILEERLPGSDLVVSGVLVRGGRAPRLITREHLRRMRPGSVIVDVAIDQGGSVETSRPTTHAAPVFVEEGVLHYCVANIPGAVPRTSTRALTQATLPALSALADMGWQQASQQNPGLACGVNISAGSIVHPAVAAAFAALSSP
ncbi:MAG: alanine dehydrogenase [Magnetococcus sp. WYHC-3]